jgi:hypothetical protein
MGKRILAHYKWGSEFNNIPTINSKDNVNETRQISNKSLHAAPSKNVTESRSNHSTLIAEPDMFYDSMTGQLPIPPSASNSQKLTNNSSGNKNSLPNKHTFPPDRPMPETRDTSNNVPSVKQLREMADKNSNEFSGNSNDVTINRSKVSPMGSKVITGAGISMIPVPTDRSNRHSNKVDNDVANGRRVLEVPVLSPGRRRDEPMDVDIAFLNSNIDAPAKKAAQHHTADNNKGDAVHLQKAQHTVDDDDHTMISNAHTYISGSSAFPLETPRIQPDDQVHKKKGGVKLDITSGASALNNDDDEKRKAKFELMKQKKIAEAQQRDEVFTVYIIIGKANSVSNNVRLFYI